MNKIYFDFPKNCPECGEPTLVSGKFLVCTNDACSGLGTGNLERWVTVLNIDSVGPKIIQMLYDKQLVREPADFYKLTVSQVSELERMGERSATKIIENLKAKMCITLPEFIAGLNMPNFSTETAQALIKAGYNDILKIYNATEEQLIAVNGIGEKTASQIKKGLQEKAVVIKNLFDVGITIKEPEKIKTDSEVLKGKSFCFTGTIQTVNISGDRLTREDMHAIVIKNGGQIEKTVKKGLTYLVVGEDAGSKLDRAKQLNIPVLSELEFFNLLK